MDLLFDGSAFCTSRSPKERKLSIPAYRSTEQDEQPIASFADQVVNKDANQDFSRLSHYSAILSAKKPVLPPFAREEKQGGGDREKRSPGYPPQQRGMPTHIQPDEDKKSLYLDTRPGSQHRVDPYGFRKK